jgi:glycosyltransferase involved in cell wall biosynthesis
LTADTSHTPEDILCITLSFWDGPKRVRHNLMREYVKRGHRVLFVEAALTWVKLLKGTDFWKQAALLFRGVRQTPDGVLVAMVPPFFPGSEWFEWICRLNWWMVRIWLKLFTLPSLKMKSPRLFLFAPHAGSLVGKFQESASIYFCNDPFAELFEHPSARPNLQRMEDKLTRKADVVFTVSERLTDERQRHNSNTHLIPLAADTALFSKALDDATPIPDELRQLSRPVIGHMGVINTRVDIPLVRQLAKLLPGASFVFVGPILELGSQMRQDLLGLQSCGNVHFLGDKPEESLPSYCKGIDVFIVPYLRDDVTKYIKANAKFFQYVASGRPVVSTIGPADLDDVIVRTAVTPETFAEAIKIALTQRTPEAQAKRLAFARNNSWGERVDRIERILNSMHRSNQG